jgi:hypothetical protein
MSPVDLTTVAHQWPGPWNSFLVEKKKGKKKKKRDVQDRKRFDLESVMVRTSFMALHGIILFFCVFDTTGELVAAQRFSYLSSFLHVSLCSLSVIVKLDFLSDLDFART